MGAAADNPRQPGWSVVNRPFRLGHGAYDRPGTQKAGGGGAVKRERATTLVTEMLQRLHEGAGWPLELVDAVYLFGSYVRGALEPHDVDIAVDFHRDEQKDARLVSYLVSSARDPRIDLRQALIGRRRGIQFQWEASERQQLEREGVAMLLLWRRGDTLEQALAVLHGIKEDSNAGRAPRDDMIEEFEGLDRYIPRPVRHDLVHWRDAGQITISRLTLPDADVMPPGRETVMAIDGRWNLDSPLRRTALSALEHARILGAAIEDIELAGEMLYTSTRSSGRPIEPRWWINWQWRRYRAIPRCLAEGDGWLEIPHPPRVGPLDALLFVPGLQ